MKALTTDFPFQKRVLWLNGAVPLLLLAYDLSTKNLGANPPEAVIRTTGVIAILFLVLTLLITPLAKYAKMPWLIRHRRWLGLWCFYYALIHMLSYSVFDKALNISEIVTDIWKRPFILLGFAGFLILIPLAVTSTDQMVRRLGGKNWKRLHRFTYAVVPLVATHYWLIVKSDITYPAIFAATFAALLGYRLISAF